ncbi:MAG: ABC transporter substrate-binding protein [Deltaproteobacteria bacterium]|nr:ABC transporter substrate-binding protein [Deltaproteobacteria bacterium]
MRARPVAGALAARLPAVALAALAPIAVLACGNNPYPGGDDALRVLYTPYSAPPKTLDPQVAYATVDHDVLSNVYETLLEYHYLRRPYELIPALATAVPEPRRLPDGGVAYAFTLRPGIAYGTDPCFALGTPGATSRELVASDLAFGLQRIADPAVGSPVLVTFAKIRGLAAFGERLAARRAGEPGFAALRIDEQYRRAGPVEGLRVTGPYRFEVVLDAPYPQILYWFAMPFTSPVPWEAVAWYDGEDGRPPFAEVAVGTGPFRLARYDKRSRIVLDRNPDWWGARHPEWRAPSALYPADGEPGDAARGALDPRLAGRPLPFLDRVEMRLEKESIPAFAKFVQGYYDRSAIPKESFDRTVSEGRLGPEMEARGMRLERAVRPGVYYLGFNMDDPVVGAPAGARARKLRQAMSLAVDVPEFLRVFLNRRGIPAQSPIPPGIFGYDPAYRNPYRTLDLERARALLADAGYPGGVDPASGRALRITFDTPDTTVQSRLRFQFLIDGWKQLGLDVELAATSYNQFRDKVRNGAYQLFFWGWVADYPDPENFLFLLWSEMAEAKSGGPNTANFADPRFDALFDELKDLENGPRRAARIRAALARLETERPWIELFHPEDYALVHGWLDGVKPMGLPVPVWKYYAVTPDARAVARRAWNQPVRWPAWALGGLALAGLGPAVATWRRERRA